MLLHALQRVVRFLVVAEGLGLLIERHLLAEAIGGVGQVNQRGRIMAFKNIRVEIGLFPRLDGLDEIAEMIAAAWAAPRFNSRQLHILLLALGNELGTLEGAAFQVINIADALVVILAGF